MSLPTLGLWETGGVSSFQSFFRRLFSSTRSGHPAGLTALDPVSLNVDRLIVGLGNPGAKYADTRHNVGYMTLEDLLAEGGDILAPVRGIPAEAALVGWDGQQVLLARPTTYMNLSGEAVGPLAKALGLSPEQIIVIHDELDLPPGKVRIKLGGNENGHNGLKSLTEHLGTRDYARVRIGIARPPQGMTVPDYVLGPVTGGAELDAAITTAADAARLVASAGVITAQNQIHAR